MRGSATYLLGDLARLVGGVEDFVVEDGEVQGKTQSDRMRGRKVRRGNIRGALVRVKGRSSRLLAGFPGLELREVPVVVSLHLVVEDLGLFGVGVRDQGLVDDAEDVITDVNEFRLNLGLVVLDERHLLGVSFLLNAGHHTPRGTAGSNHVLVRNREQVALFDGKLRGVLGDFLHVGNHFVKALGLLGQLGWNHNERKTRSQPGQKNNNDRQSKTEPTDRIENKNASSNICSRNARSGVPMTAAVTQ